VSFDIRDNNGNLLTSVITDENGTTTFYVDSTVPSISIYEYAETNPLAIPPTGEFEFDDIHCPCGHSDIVIVNLLEE
jgi:hypothetical protein